METNYLSGDDADDFTLDFFTDAVICTIERWLRKKDCMPPDQFFDRLWNTTQKSVDALHREIHQQ